VPTNAAPPPTVVCFDDAIDPVTLRVPASTLVLPVYMFAADKVSEPGPLKVMFQLPAVKADGGV
jgi:hypothetical protein